MVPSGEEGERLLSRVVAALGPPAGAPQVVKGGSCGGEEEDGEFPFVGAMVSVSWEFPREGREEFLSAFRSLFGGCEEIAG